MVVCVLEAKIHFPPHTAFVHCFITAAESNWAELVKIITEGIRENHPGPRKMSSELKNQSWLCKYFIPNKQIPCDFKGDHGHDLKLLYMKDKVLSGRLTEHTFLVIYLFLTRILWTMHCYLIWDVYMERDNKENNSKKREVTTMISCWKSPSTSADLH